MSAQIGDTQQNGAVNTVEMTTVVEITEKKPETCEDKEETTKINDDDPFGFENHPNNFADEEPPEDDVVYIKKSELLHPLQEKSRQTFNRCVQNAIDFAQSAWDKVCFVTVCQVQDDASASISASSTSSTDSPSSGVPSPSSGIPGDSSNEVTDRAALRSKVLNGNIVESLILFTKCRVIICSNARRNARVMYDFHMWNVQRVNVDYIANSITFVLADNYITVYVVSPYHVISAFGETLSRILPVKMFPELKGMPHWPLFLNYCINSVSTDIPASWRPVRKLHPVELYLAQCSYLKRRCNPTFIQYLNSLVESGNKSLNLTTSLVCCEDDAPTCIGFLAYDEFFRGILLSKRPVKDALSWIGRVIAVNKHLTLLVVQNLQAEERQVTEVLESISNAGMHSLCSIDLSGNNLRDSGAKLLGQILSTVNHSMVSLKISNCGITPRGMQCIFGGLLSNLSASLVLQTVDVSDNRLEETGSQALNKWISAMIPEVPHLRSLGLGHTKARLSQITSLSEVPNLSILDIRGIEIDDTVASILTKPLWHLQELNVGECAFKKDRVVSVLLQSLFSGQKKSVVCKMDNAVIGDIKRAAVAGASDSLIRTLVSLPIRDMLQHVQLGNCGGLLPSVMSALNDSNSLQIFESAHPGSLESPDPLFGALRSLVTTCPNLAVLSLTDGYSPNVIVPLLRLLPTQNPLRVLDISNNQLSNIFNEISPVLTSTNNLMILHMRGNGTKREGLEQIAAALSENSSLCELDILDDFSTDISVNPLLMDTACALQRKLSDNIQSQKDYLKTLPLNLVPYFARVGESSIAWNSFLPTDVIAWETAPPLVTLAGESSPKTHIRFLRKHLKR